MIVETAYIRKNPIPANYTGTLTFTELRGVSEGDSIDIWIARLPLTKSPNLYQGSVDVDNNISFNFTATQELFYEHGDYVIQFNKTSDASRVLVINPEDTSESEDRDGILISFTADKQTGLPFDLELTNYSLLYKGI